MLHRLGLIVRDGHLHIKVQLRRQARPATGSR